MAASVLAVSTVSWFVASDVYSSESNFQLLRSFSFSVAKAGGDFSAVVLLASSQSIALAD